jgi:hypothetical protein
MPKDRLPPRIDPAGLNAAVAKAWLDREYREQFLADPARALREAGIEVPEGVRVTVREFDPDEYLIFVPPARAASSAGPREGAAPASAARLWWPPQSFSHLSA